jgi:hypothetical protein
MAEVTVLDPNEPPDTPEAEPAPAQKNRGGRPPGRAQATTRWQRETTPEERAGFFEHTSGLSEVDWENHLLYVYMWSPIVDLTRGGVEKKNRRVYTRHKSEEDIKRDLGSGTYELRLNRIDPLTRRERTDRRIVIGILDYDFPPSIPPGQWLDDPRNADWLWAKPMLEKKYGKPEHERAPANGQPTFLEMMDFMDRRETRHRQAREGEPKEASIDKVIDAVSKAQQVALTSMAPKHEFNIVDVIKLIKDSEKPTGIDPVLSQVLTGLREDLKAAREEAKAEREANRKLLDRIIDGKKEDSNPLSQLDTYTNIFTRMTELAGRGGPRDWKDVIADTVGDVLPKAVELGQFYVTQKQITDRMRPPQRPPAPGAPAAASPPPATAMPPAAVPSPAANPAAPPASTAAAAPDPTAGTAGLEMDINERTQLVNIAILAAQALNLTLKGDEFAEKICDRYGGVAYDDFVAAFDRTQLLAKLKTVPEAWQLLAEHEPRLPEFIEAFYHFADPEQEEPQPEPAQPEPAKPAAKAKKPAAKGKKK